MVTGICAFLQNVKNKKRFNQAVGLFSSCSSDQRAQAQHSASAFTREGTRKKEHQEHQQRESVTQSPFAAAMSLEESFTSDLLGDFGLVPPNASGVVWEQRYNIWPPGIGIAAIYGAIIAVGLVGNVSLMKTCLSVKSMRTVPNLFLSSLALGDVLLLLTCAPVDASRYLVDEWLFGRVGCKLIPFIQLASVGVSVFTLTALSADR